MVAQILSRTACVKFDTRLVLRQTNMYTDIDCPTRALTIADVNIY